MSSEEIATASVTPALSTAQNEDAFGLQKYDSVAIDRACYLGPHAASDERNSVGNYHAVDEIVDFLKQNEKYRNITLQFPDSLIQDSSIVVQLLQEKLNMDSGTVKRRFWALADTAYSACCVDEVAAEHAKGDLVIHFGDACFKAVQSLPVVYSLGRPYLDLEEVAKKFSGIFNDKCRKICLLADAPHTYILSSLYEKLEEEGYENLIYGVVDEILVADTSVILQQKNDDNHSAKRIGNLGNRVLMTNKRDSKALEEDIIREEFALFHITIPQDPHLLFLVTKFESVILYDPKDNTITEGPYPSLMKRYKNMHVARTAGCIGILVNTLSLRNTKEMINTLVKLIRDNGKKHYLFVVGKPNVAKLANFEPVDIWCILGCGQAGIILDQYNEFYKPIITPYELTMALKEEVTWTGQWVVDFEKVLNEIAVNETEPCEERNESDEPEFDAVTGKYVSTSRPLRHIQHLEIEGPKETESRSLIQKVNGGVIIKGTVSTAAASIQNREWTGLGSDFTAQDDYEEEGATVQEGISGVASSYEFDKLNSRNQS